MTWTEHAGLSRLDLRTGPVTVHQNGGGGWWYNVRGCSYGPHASRDDAKAAALADIQRRIEHDAAAILTEGKWL